MRAFTHTARSVFAVVLAAGMTWAALQAQQAAGRVVIRVVTNDGLPVLDLKKENFTIRVDGKPRQIVSLELVTPAAGSAAGAGTAAAAATLPAPYTINVDTPAGVRGGREFIIGIDDEGLAPGRDQGVKEAITKLIAALAPGDRVGLASLRNGGVMIQPSTDRAAVTAALEKIISIGSPRESLNDLACRTKIIMGTLGDFLRTGGPDRTVVLFVAGLSPTTEETVRQSLTPNATACEIRTRELEELGRLAQTAPPALIVVTSQEAIANPANASAGQAGADNIAGVTGGQMIRLASPDSAVNRITQNAGAYYVATLDGPIVDPRRVDLRVDREDVRSLARPMSSAGGSYAVGSSKGNAKTTPRDMIRVGTAFRDVPLRAAAFVSRQAGTHELKVMALFEPDEPATKLNAAVVGFFNEKGDLKAQWTAQSAELQRAPVVAALMVPPGTYRMRVAVTDGDGRAGTTDVPVKVELTDLAPVKLGAMILSLDQSSPRLLFRSNDPQVIGFLPVYGVTNDMKVSVRYEILRDAASQPLGTTDGNLLQVPNEPDAKLVWGGFGLQPLEPGDYLMRAVVSLNGKEIGSASRTLRKVK